MASSPVNYAQSPMRAHVSANAQTWLPIISEVTVQDLKAYRSPKQAAEPVGLYDYYNLQSKSKLPDVIAERMDKKIEDIRNNDGIFRQDSSWIPSLITNAIKIFSLVSSFVGSPSSPAKAPPTKDVGDPDRIDPPSVVGQGDDIDEAMGTLMAYGGKYLREMVLWAFEHATNTPSLPLGSPGSGANDKVDVVSTSVTTTTASSPTTTAAVTGTTATTTTTTVTTTVEVKPPEPPKESPLKQLSPQELEDLGLKAVDAGAEPTKLQQAFASAQINGDWTHLEMEIIGALGPESIPGAIVLTPQTTTNPTTASHDPVATTSATPSHDILTSPPSLPTATTATTAAVQGDGGIIGALKKIIGLSPPATGVHKIGEAVATSDAPPATSEVPTGLGYYSAVAQQYIKRIDKVIQGPDPGTPVSDPMDESVITRFIKEFELQQEALALQSNVNNVIQTVNQYVGSESAQASSENNLANTGGITNTANVIPPSTSTSSSSSSTGGVMGLVSSIPDALGGMAAAALKFVSPSAGTSAQPAVAENKLGETSETGGTEVHHNSEVNAMNAANTVVLGSLGTAAVGSVLWSMYVNSLEANKRRRNGRSVLEDHNESLLGDSEVGHQHQLVLTTSSASTRNFQASISRQAVHSQEGRLCSGSSTQRFATLIFFWRGQPATAAAVDS